MTTSEATTRAVPSAENPLLDQADPRPLELDPADLSLAERVLLQLRDEILSARRSAGATMRERDVAEELGVSRVPVRAALPRLESSGLIVTSPRRPAVITSISTRDVRDLFDLRAAFEPGLTALAARNVARGADGSPLADTLEQAQGHLIAGDNEAFQRANAQLHDAIVALTDNELARRMHALLDDRVERLNRVSFHHDDESRHREHVEMARAVLAGREGVAHAATALHIDHERDRVLEALPTHPHYAGH